MVHPFLLLLFPLGVISTVSPSPVSLPWKNITLTDGVGINRGIELLLGGQRLGLRGTTTYANTRIRNARDCSYGTGNGNDTAAETGCLGASGSLFDTRSAADFRLAPPGNWSVVATDGYDPEESVSRGYARAEFEGVPAIDEFPVEVWSRRDSDNKSALALGRDGSFIQRLVGKKVVPSGVWGLFFGSRSQLRGVDGALTIGGYDAARVDGGGGGGGAWTNFSVDAEYLRASACPLQVLVKDIFVTTGNGSEHSVFADQAAMVGACVDPLQNSFTFTRAMAQRFWEITEHAHHVPGEGANFTDQTYPPSKEHLMQNLTVVLSNGHTTVIPHYELVSQERGTAQEEGKYTVTNASRIMVAVAPDPEDDGSGDVVPILGGVYLSQNYLLVDYERKSWSLAPAVIGKMDDGQRKIVAVLGDVEKSGGKTSINVGGVVGGVIVAVIILATAAVGVFYQRKRTLNLRRQKVKERADTCSDKELDTRPTVMEMRSRTTTQPVPATVVMPSELANSSRVELV